MAVEGGLLLGVLLLGALVSTAVVRQREAAFIGRFTAFAARPVAPYALVAALTFAWCVAAGVIYPPAPKFHDEMSYLLQADTFAQGRLANPAHPMARFFEAFHVIQAPTYASKYPPGQGLVLAPGQLIGMPWLSTYALAAAAAAAILWMLKGWLTAPWALAGALAYALHPRILLAWNTGYWGGTLPLLGAALVFGAVGRRTAEERRSGSAEVRSLPALGIGAVILGLSRPYEGLLALVPALLVLAKRVPFRYLLTRVAPTLALCAAGLVAFTLTYNRAVTGDPFVMPYALHHRTYDSAGMFVFEPPRFDVSYPNSTMRQVLEYDGRVQSLQRAPLPWLLNCLYKTWYQLRFHLGLLLLLPFFLGWRESWRDNRWAPATILAALGGNYLLTYQQPHYLAPAIPAAIYIIARGAAKLRSTHLSAGALAFALTPLIALAWQAARGPDTFEQQRRSLIAHLTATGERHLVVVRPAYDQDPHADWVANGADLEGAAVLFARDLGPVETDVLLAHYQGRKAWLLKLAGGKPELFPLGSAP